MLLHITLHPSICCSMTDAPSLFCIDYCCSNSKSHSTCLYSQLDTMFLPHYSHLINLLTPDVNQYGDQDIQQSVYRWLCRSGWVQSSAGLSLGLNHQHSPHISHVTQITVFVSTTSWICLLANRKLSKGFGHGRFNLLGGPRVKNVPQAPC